MNDCGLTVLLTAAPDALVGPEALGVCAEQAASAAARAGHHLTVALDPTPAAPIAKTDTSATVDAVVHLRAGGATGPDGDARLRAALSHPHLRLVLEAPRLEDTAELVVAALLSAAGLPEPVEAERKFLLAQAPDLTVLSEASVAVVDIEQVYLPGVDGVETRVRRWSQGGDVHFIHTVKHDRPDGARTEVEHAITAEEYARLAAAPAAGSVAVRKRRHVSVQGAHRLELDEFLEPVRAWLLEVELESTSAPLTLPGWVGAAREVTTDPAWRNRALAGSGRCG